MPGYRAYLDAQDLTPAYQYVKRLFQFLQWQKKARGESAERWVVEGKGDTTLEVEVTVTEQGATETFTEQLTNLTYSGLWEVDTDTGEITARDSEARSIQELGCFNPH